MSVTDPITCPALLGDADNVEAVALLRGIVSDLTARGVTSGHFMIAQDVAHFFKRLQLVPRPESALPIFLGLAGEAALTDSIARWSDVGTTGGQAWSA